MREYISIILLCSIPLFLIVCVLIGVIIFIYKNNQKNISNLLDRVSANSLDNYKQHAIPPPLPEKSNTKNINTRRTDRMQIPDKK